MARSRLRTPLLGAAVTALAAGVIFLGGAGAADAEDTAARTKSYQKQFLDPQAPIGTEAKGSKKASIQGQQDSPVKTNAVNPDTASVLSVLPSTTGGRWTSLPSLPSGSNAYHLIMGPKGKILLLAGSGNNSAVFEAGTFTAYVWEPSSGALKPLTTPTDMFCSGHMLMSNGKGIGAGGTTDYSPFKGSKALYTFDFATESFVPQQNMVDGRWYPSLVNTPSGYALIIGGFDEGGLNSKTSEVYKPATQTYSAQPAAREFPLYPHIFLTGNAKYFFTGEGWIRPPEDVNSEQIFFHPGFWEPFNGNRFTRVNDLTVPNRRGYGASCWLGDIRLQKIMVMGGGWPATLSTNVIDLNSSSSPTYATGPQLRALKAYLSCVNLPDGTLLELGGGSANKIENASRTVSLLKSSTATSWTAMNPLPGGEHRLYHSMAFLADDGSVISLSSNPKDQARSDTVLRFEPPYLFRGARPTLGGVPSLIAYGQTYSINVSGDVTRVVMMSAPSPTHGFDANQRYIPLQYGNGKITINATSGLAPRGYYRLFAINAKGAISTAKWTQLK